jgi:protein-arginine kinase activator protein McsA
MAGIGESEIEQSNAEIEQPKEPKRKKREKSLSVLKNDLAKAIAREDYERASKLRDEIEQRQENE